MADAVPPTPPAPADVPDAAAHPTDVPTALTALDARDAALRLAAADPSGARGFLGLDPVTQNTPLLARLLEQAGARVLLAGDTLLGYATNPAQPRQARIASTGADPAPVGALLDFLRTYHRCTSFVAEVPEGAAALPALEASGFTRTGVLPGHVYRSGGYHDVLVYCAAREG